jgi:hypothetical protein
VMGWMVFMGGSTSFPGLMVALTTNLAVESRSPSERGPV